MKLFSFSLASLFLALHWIFFAYFPFKKEEQKKTALVLETCCSILGLIFVIWLTFTY